MSPSRRTFLGHAAAFGLLTLMSRSALSRQDTLGSDEDAVASALDHARRSGWDRRPIGEVVALMGQRFLGAPYVAHTLEAEGPERLLVNLREFDCTTFIESMLALSRCVRIPGAGFAEYKAQLRLLRYRSGVIDGYPSRLHYFTDWIADNVSKGTVADLTRELGGIARSARIAYMSEHTGAYRQLADSAALAAIRTAERDLSGRMRWYIPRDRVPEMQSMLRDGDLIGITTSVDGLDVAHTGMIVVRSDQPVFLHASLSGDCVELADGTLSTYLRRYRTHDGILVARPREPERSISPR